MARNFRADYVCSRLAACTQLTVPVTIALLSIIALATAIQIVGLDFVGPTIWFVGMVSLGVAIAQRWCLNREQRSPKGNTEPTRSPSRAGAAGAVAPVQAPKGTDRQRGREWGAVYWVYFLVPVFVIWVARTIFNATVACSKISFDFAASLPGLSTITNMPPAVVLETYYWGLALVGGMALAGVTILTALYSLYFSLCRALPRSEGGVLSLLVICVVGVVVFIVGHFLFLPIIGRIALVGLGTAAGLQAVLVSDPPRAGDSEVKRGRQAVAIVGAIGASVLFVIVEADYVPANCITNGLIGQSIERLPATEIGSIQNNLRSFGEWGTGLLAAATICILPAIALLLRYDRASDDSDSVWDDKLDERSVRLRHMTFALAGALVASYLVAHFHLGIGARVVESVVQPLCLDPPSGAVLSIVSTVPECTKPREVLSAYGQLRQAAEVYWMVITSLALACLYFPAATVLWLWHSPAAVARVSSPVLTLLGRLAAVLSPLLAGGIVTVIGDLVGSP